jgi:hypothetical protein
VLPGDEPDIHDRVKTHGCDGFIGLAVPSTGLATKLNAAGLPRRVYCSRRFTGTWLFGRHIQNTGLERSGRNTSTGAAKGRARRRWACSIVRLTWTMVGWSSQS